MVRVHVAHVGDLALLLVVGVLERLITVDG